MIFVSVGGKLFAMMSLANPVWVLLGMEPLVSRPAASSELMRQNGL